jgi:hypothetical protein
LTVIGQRATLARRTARSARRKGKVGAMTVVMATKKLCSALAVAALVCGVACTAAPANAAGPGSGSALVSTVWACTNGDVLTFALPAVAVSPGQGALVAPFPGFLTAVDEVGAGQTTPQLGTWIVLALVSSTGTQPIGKKVGLTSGSLTCTLEGTTVTVVVAPAAR